MIAQLSSESLRIKEPFTISQSPVKSCSSQSNMKFALLLLLFLAFALVESFEEREFLEDENDPGQRHLFKKVSVVLLKQLGKPLNGKQLRNFFSFESRRKPMAKGFFFLCQTL